MNMMIDENLLSSNHRRSLSVTSKILEEELDEVEAVLNGNYNNKITEIIEPSYDDETKKEILRIITEIKTANEEMFRELSLTQYQTFESRILQSRAVHLWSILIESNSTNLARYGDMSPEAGKFVDGFIYKILALLDKLKKYT
jgi:hypothetical protein